MDENSNFNDKTQQAKEYSEIIIPPANNVDHDIMDLPADLDDLSFEDAKEYVVNIIAVKKRYEKDIQEKTIELNQFIQQKQNTDTQDIHQLTQIDEMIHHHQDQLNKLKVEEMEVSVKLDQLKEALEKKKNEIQTETNAGALLESMEQLLGKSSADITLEKETESLQLENKLAELKNKMNQ